MVTVLQLLESTYKVGLYTEGAKNTRHPAYVFSKKHFGGVYAYNKTVVYKPGHNIVELSIIIGAVTDKGKSAHRVLVALNGIESKEYSTKELVHLIKVSDARLSEVDDGEIIQNVLKEVPFLPGKIIIQKDSNKNKFIVFSSRIPLKSEIRVSCSCSDYFFTFQWYNSEAKCNIGQKPPKYKKYIGLNAKERRSLTPIRNPRRLPGLCKHQLLFLALLMQNGVLDISQPVLSNLNKSSSKIQILSRQDITNVLSNLKAETELKKQEIRAQRAYNNAVEKEMRKK